MPNLTLRPGQAAVPAVVGADVPRPLAEKPTLKYVDRRAGRRRPRPARRLRIRIALPFDPAWRSPTHAEAHATPELVL